MTVITISREFGSGGNHIAQQVAQALGFHFADKEVIGRVLAQYGLAEFDTEYDALPGFWDRFDARRMERRDVMVDMLNRAIQALAHHGNMVILGRCGFAVLRGYDDVLNVRLQAPFDDRVKRAMEDQNIADVSQAEAAIKEGDKVRSSFIEEFYGVSWDSAQAFDLVLDTGKIPLELAIVTITQAAKALPDRTRRERRLASAAEADPVLASAVAYELKCEVAHNVELLRSGAG
jgi:cytidylate kinase